MHILLQATPDLGESELRLIFQVVLLALINPVLIMLALRRILKRHQLGLIDGTGAIIWIFVFFLCPLLGSLGYLVLTRRLPVR